MSSTPERGKRGSQDCSAWCPTGRNPPHTSDERLNRPDSASEVARAFAPWTGGEPACPARTPPGASPTGRPAKQLRTLRSLALSRGQTFSNPATKAQGSAEIRRLLRARGHSFVDRQLEADELQRITAARDGAAVREHEVSGHGSSARWTHHQPKAS